MNKIDLDSYEKKLLNSKYFFHITHKDNLKSIAKFGLKPDIGSRNKSVGDNRQAVFVFTDLSSTICFFSQLYKGDELENFALLLIMTKEELFIDRFISDSVYSLTTIDPKDINIINNIYLPSSKINFSLETFSNVVNELLSANNYVLEENMFLFNRASNEGVISKTPIIEFVKNSTMEL